MTYRCDEKRKAYMRKYMQAWYKRNPAKRAEHRFNEKLRRMGLDPKRYNPGFYGGQGHVWNKSRTEF